MKAKVCKGCGREFDPGSDGRRRMFCGLSCCWSWRRENKGKLRGTFKDGIVPWNTGTKGVMKRSSTSFTKGVVPKNKTTIGEERIRTDKKGVRRCWVKIGEGRGSYDWKLRAVVVWERFNGNLSHGMLVHHIDRNTLNDAIENLHAMTRAEHLKEHRSEHEKRRSRAAADAARDRHRRKRLERRGHSKPPVAVL